MDISIKRIVHIIACMCCMNAQAVDDRANDECYLFLGTDRSRLPIFYDEILYLLERGVIEVNTANDEEGYENRVYILTDEAISRIRTILRNRKAYLLES